MTTIMPVPVVRITRRVKLTRWLVRLLLGSEWSVWEKAELDNLFGFVWLHNDTKPVIDAARAVFGSKFIDGRRYRQRAVITWNTGALADALDRYDELYPEHVR